MVLFLPNHQILDHELQIASVSVLYLRQHFPNITASGNMDPRPGHMRIRDVAVSKITERSQFPCECGVRLGVAQGEGGPDTPGR